MITHPDHSQRPAPDDRRFLEALCFWRAVYARRGPQDTVVVSSVAQTIADAERQLHSQHVVDARLMRRFVGR